MWPTADQTDAENERLNVCWRWQYDPCPIDQRRGKSSRAQTVVCATV